MKGFGEDKQKRIEKEENKRDDEGDGEKKKGNKIGIRR